MKQRKMPVRQLAKSLGAGQMPLPGAPIGELAGDRRFLIENHRGIREYSAERIAVGVSYGSILVEGSSLEICSMTCHRVVILGRISRITLERGKC